MGLLPLWTYLALGVFIVGCIYKAVHYARMPMHLRWELYPVAHEKGRASYGGSYFEEVDWWTKPRQSSKLGEVKVIAEEVLTLKAVREHNPGLWLPSLLFHYGLYLLFALGVGLLAGGVAMAARIPQLQLLTGGTLLTVWGVAGLALGTVGALLLLFRRLTRGDLRRSSTPADFFHLVLLLGVFASSWGAFLTVDRQFSLAVAYLSLLVTGRPITPGSGWFVAQVTLLGVFLAYLPWSHMTHMFTKYFTWHSVRWEDRPNLPGEGIDVKAAKLLALPVSWSAPHIKGDGRKSWVDVAQESGEV
jgi:nitrate reductase gamma subunit